MHPLLGGAIIKHRDPPGVLKLSWARISETFRFGVGPDGHGAAGPRFSFGRISGPGSVAGA
jgi:hypothetical protein